MCAALVGGLDRLRRQYIQAAGAKGVKLDVFSGRERSVSSRLTGRDVDLYIVFTNMVSHEARKEVVRLARKNNVHLALSHSCGVSSLRRTLDAHDFDGEKR
jgi:hypothetical protein